MRSGIVTKYVVKVDCRQSGKTQRAIDMWVLNTDYKLYVCNRRQVLHRIEESIGEWTHNTALELMQKAYRNIKSLSAYDMISIGGSKNVIIDEPSMIPNTQQREILASGVLDGLDTLTVFGTHSGNDVLLDHVIGLSIASNKITSIIMPVGSQDSFSVAATKALELRDINRVPVGFSFNKVAIMCELNDNIGSVINRYNRLHSMAYGNSY